MVVGSDETEKHAVRSPTCFSPPQTQNRMKLMADNYEDDNLKVTSPNAEQPNNHKPSPDQARPL